MILRFYRSIIDFGRDEHGATAIEYAMIASLISVAILTAVLGVNGGMHRMFDDVYTKITAALTGAGDA